MIELIEFFKDENVKIADKTLIILTPYIIALNNPFFMTLNNISIHTKKVTPHLQNVNIE